MSFVSYAEMKNPFLTFGSANKINFSSCFNICNIKVLSQWIHNKETGLFLTVSCVVGNSSEGNIPGSNFNPFKMNGYLKQLKN